MLYGGFSAMDLVASKRSEIRAAAEQIRGWDCHKKIFGFVVWHGE